MNVVELLQVASSAIHKNGNKGCILEDLKALLPKFAFAVKLFILESALEEKQKVVEGEMYLRKHY